VGIDSQLQRRIFGQFATGVTVVTTKRGDQFHGMTANAVTSLSLDPALVLVAVDKRAGMHAALCESHFFALNILSETQEHLSRRFAMTGAKEFGDILTSTAETGALIFVEALAWVDCRLKEVLPGGDHDIFIGEIVAGALGKEGRPLLYFSGKYHKIGE
jgi:flavin reductase (DIM6/NTAB) family NADH-FMN oxidoreductase RutF